MELEKSPFCNHQSNNWFTQESSMDAKTTGEKLDNEQGGYFPTLKISLQIT